MNDKKYNIVNFDEFLKQTNTSVPSNNREIDVQGLLTQRLMNQAMSSPVSSRVCSLTENVPVYRKLNTGSFMVGPNNFVVFSGNSNDLQNKQFEFKGMKSCMLIEDQSQAIDLSRLHEGSNKKINLIELSAPFIGTILVPEHCVVGLAGMQRNNNQPGNRILKG